MLYSITTGPRKFHRTRVLADWPRRQMPWRSATYAKSRKFAPRDDSTMTFRDEAQNPSVGTRIPASPRPPGESMIHGGHDDFVILDGNSISPRLLFSRSFRSVCAYKNFVIAKAVLVGQSPRPDRSRCDALHVVAGKASSDHSRCVVSTFLGPFNAKQIYCPEWDWIRAQQGLPKVGGYRGECPGAHS